MIAVHCKLLFALRLRLITFFLTLLLSDVASAAGGNILIDPAPKEGYTLAIGSSFLVAAAYPGSSRYKISTFPGVDFYSSTGLFLSTDEGFGWNISARDDLQAGFRLWAQAARNSGDSPRLTGMGKIGPRLEKGAFLNYQPYEFLVLQGSVRHGGGVKGDGLLLELGATTGLPLGERAIIGVSLGVTWANRAYSQSYFGVTEEQARYSSLPITSMQSGLQDINLGISSEYRIDRNWKLGGLLNGARLLDNAARSPITECRLQSIFSITLWRIF